MDLFIVCLDWLLITYNFLCYIVRFDFAGATIQVWGDEHALQRSRFLVAAIQGYGDVSACFAKKSLFGGGYTGVGRRASWMRIGDFSL